MYIKAVRLQIILLFLMTGFTLTYGAGDTTQGKTNLPAGFFQQRVIEGSTSARVLSLDKGVNGVTFVNPYTAPSTMTVWSGNFSGDIDGNAAKFYCIDISHYLAFWKSDQPHLYTDNGTTPASITYILNKYYPYKAYPYTGSLSTVEKEAAAIQVAIWHFADGVDANTVTTSDIKTRALAIIADANANSANTSILTSFSILPSTQTVNANASASFTVSALNAQGQGVSGLLVSLTTTAGALSTATATTGSSGQTPVITLSQGAATQATVSATTTFIIPEGTRYEHASAPNNYQKLVLATPTMANRLAQGSVIWNPPAGNCDLNGYMTFTQGGWGSPSNSTPGGIRDTYFDDVFPNGLTVGGNYTAKFTSAAAIMNFLPAGGTANKFTQNYTNPSSTSAGVLGGQVVALAMNVFFDSAGVFGNNYPRLGDLVVTSGTFTGKTVSQILSYAYTAIGGGSVPYSLSDLNAAATAINENFDNGTSNNNYLTCPTNQPSNCASASSISSDFNGTAISAGNYIWFNSHLKLKGAGSTPTTIYLDNAKVSFTAGSTMYSVTVPSAQIIFTSAVTTAVTNFNSVTNTWVTQVPLSTSSNVFLTGFPLLVPAGGFPGGVKPVKFEGDFTTSNTAVSLDWQWGAAVYTQFSTNYNSLGVQLVDGSLHAGTPVSFKSFVTGGARGGGGSNYTGSLSSTGHVIPCLYVQKSSLGDRVWNDANQNGIQDAGEPGISGITVKLYDCNNTLINTTTTDGNGNYSFTNLNPGSYYLMFTAPAGFVFSPKNQGSDVTKDSDPDPVTGKTACYTLPAGENNLSFDAGIYTPKASIGDFVWNDLNKNGIQDANEPGLANVTVKLYNCNNVLQSTTVTDNTGLYRFTDLVPGDYYVQVTLPAGYNFTAKNQGGDVTKDSDADPVTGKTSCTTLTPGETDLSWDAGLFLLKASLGDKVWYDVNENGLQDNGEPGIENAAVKLYDCNNTLLANTVTNQSGVYAFANLNPGSYYVEFTLPSGYKFTLKNQGGDGAKDSDADPVTGKTACVTLAPGDNNLTVDAGMYLQKASIGDFVWKDEDRDGVQDGGEPGIPGVLVKLYDCDNNFIASTVTGSGGEYSFINLVPGNYYVQFILPLDNVFTLQNQGSDTTKNSDADALTGKTGCFNVKPGVNDVTRDAGMYVPKASVGDKVWNDLNRDGAQDNPSSELGIPDVVVKLYTCSGTLVFTTTTDANGNYLFTNLTPGDYYVQFVLPSGFAFTTKNASADTTIDSDADVTNGKTACFALKPGANDLTRDAGMYLNKASVGDFVWNDLNMDGKQNNNEDGIQGITVRLYNCADVLIASTITDVNGYYSFPNIASGSYYVRFTLPSGHSFSPQNQGTNPAADSDPDPLTGKTPCRTVNPGDNIVTWDAGIYSNTLTNADLSITKTSNVTSAQNDDVVTYTITVTNNGPSQATGVTVSDVLPAGLVYLSSNPSGVYDTASGVWTVGTIPSGGTKTLQITVKVNLTHLNTTVVDLGPAKDYNMFVIEDMNVPSSDTQGKLAVGRDASLTGYSVGDQLPNSNGTEDVLVVGRDLTFLIGRVYNGNVVYGNSTNLPRSSVSIMEGTLRKDTVIDFAAASVYLNNLSTQLSTQTVNGTTTYQPFNEVTMTGTDPFLNVFLVDGAKLSTANNTSITVPNGSVVLVNIFGQKVSWGFGLQVNGTARNNALFNFYQADSLYIRGIDITGSVLAPKANVFFQAGVQHGQMICKSYRGQGQLNLDPFVGNLPVSKDLVNIAEVRTSDQNDPDSSPGNGSPTEDDYASVTVNATSTGTNAPGWNVVGNVPPNNTPLTMTNNTGGTLYAGTSAGNVYKSANGGTTWTNISPSAAVGNIWAVNVNAGSKLANRIVAGTEKGVYYTADDGLNWQVSSLANKDVRAIVTASGGALYAATWGSGVYRSLDMGQTWASVNDSTTKNLLVNSLYLDKSGQLFAAAFGGGIYKYSTLLNAWTAVPIDYKFIWGIHTAQSGILYASTYGDGVYRSFDGGETWSKMNAGLNNLYIYSITEDQQKNLVAISWGGGVYQKPANENTWKQLGLDGAGISSVLINSVSGSVFVGARNGSIFKKNGPLDVEQNGTMPLEFALSQNYPNPFNPSTSIRFTLPSAGSVTLTVYNVLGQQVRKLVDGDMMPGSYTVSFDGSDLASGIYIYRLATKNANITKKMLMVK